MASPAGTPRRAVRSRRRGARPVFVGTFDLTVVRKVCADGRLPAAGMLDLVAALVDKSVVTWERHRDESRLWMLETLREYGAEWLRALGEEKAVRRRHRDRRPGHRAERPGRSPSAGWRRRGDRPPGSTTRGRRCGSPICEGRRRRATGADEAIGAAAGVVGALRRSRRPGSVVSGPGTAVVGDRARAARRAGARDRALPRRPAGVPGTRRPDPAGVRTGDLGVGGAGVRWWNGPPPICGRRCGCAAPSRIRRAWAWRSSRWRGRGVAGRCRWARRTGCGGRSDRPGCATR